MQQTASQPTQVPQKSFYWTNVIILCYLFTFICKTLFLSSANQVRVSPAIPGEKPAEEAPVTNHDEEEEGENKVAVNDGKMPFEHPFLQVLAAIIGEFIFTMIYYVYMQYVAQDEVKQSEIRFVQFFYPAFCDFTGNVLFIFGLANMLPSMTMTSKALTLPLTAAFSVWSVTRINKTFNNKQTWSLVGICASILLVLLASYGASSAVFSSDKTGALIMLGCSACFQSFEIVLEKRIFMIEKDLTALALQQMISSWKMILLCIVVLLSNLFPGALGAVIGQNRGRVWLAFYNMTEATELYWLMFGVLFFNALAANLGMQIVKAENAVFRQSVMLLSIPALWIWHVYYGDTKDAFSVPKMFAQISVVVFVILFMIWDREAVEEDEMHKAIGKPKKNDDLEFGNEGNGVNNDDEERNGLLGHERPSARTLTSQSNFIGAAKCTDPNETAADMVSSDESSQPPHPSDDEDDEFEGERMFIRDGSESEGDSEKPDKAKDLRASSPRVD